MAGRDNTFTSFINARRTANAEAEFRAIEQMAVRTFGSIRQQAAAASRATADLTGRRTGGASSTAARRAVQDANAASNASDRLGRTSRTTARDLDRMREAEARLERQNSRLVRSLNTSAQTLGIVQGPLGPLAGRITALAGALTNLSGASLGLAGVGATLFSFVSAANTFTQVRSRLQPLFETQTQVNRAFSEVSRIAIQARTALEPVADLYVRLNATARDFGISQERAARVTRLVSMAARLSGGANQSQEAGIQQFAQGFGSGNLGGEELKSVRENTFRLAQAISQGLSRLPEFRGVDTSIGKLRELGEQGKLTSETLTRALEAASSDIEADFQKLGPTLQSSASEFGVAFTNLIGRIESTTGVTSGLASALTFVANNLPQISALLAGIAAGWVAVRAAAGVDYIRRQVGAYREVQTIARVAALQEAATAMEQRQNAAGRIVQLRNEREAIRQKIVALEQEEQAAREAAAAARQNAGAGIGAPNMMNRLAGEAEARAARATNDLARERGRLDIVSGGLQRNQERLTQGTDKYRGAVQTATNRTSLLKAAGASFLGLLNPWAIGVGLLTTAIINWWMQQDKATESSERLREVQGRLAAAIDFTTQRIIEQNQARLEGLRLEGEQGIQAGQAEYDRQRQEFVTQGSNYFRDRTTVLMDPRLGDAGRMGIPGATLTPQEREARSLIQRYASQEAGLSVGQVTQRIRQLAEQEPRLRQLADSLATMGSGIATAAQDVERLRANYRILFQGARDPQTFRVAQGDFSGGRAGGETPNRDLAAEAEALRRRLADRRFAASTQRDEQLKNLEARRGRMGADDYVRERAQILASYDQEIASIGQAEARGAARAERERERAEREEQRRLQAIEREDQARERRTERRNDVLQQWDDQPKAITRARDQIDDLNRMVGDTLNGLVAVSEENPLGQGIYTQEMADADARRIMQGVRRPLEEANREHERSLAISRLILQGRELEAEALREQHRLEDEIGEVREEDYQGIILRLQREQEMNDLLASRERIMAPLRNSVEDLRSSVNEFLMEIGQGRPVNAVRDLARNLFQSFARAEVARITESVTQGLDSRIRDLLSGRTRVDQAVAEIVTGMTDAADGSRTLAEATRTAAERIDQATINLTAGAPAGAGGDEAAAANLRAWNNPTVVERVATTLSRRERAIAPLRGFNGISSGFGWRVNPVTHQTQFHGGLDFPAPAGTPVRAAFSGRVTHAGWLGNTGNTVIIEHGNGLRTVYGHLSRISTSLNRMVEQGATLGGVGSTGRSTGNHLHYATQRFNGRTRRWDNVDPRQVQAITSTITRGDGPIGGESIPNASELAADAVSFVRERSRAATSSAERAALGLPGADDNQIVVTAPRRADRGIPSTREVYNAIGSSVGERIDRALGTKFFQGIGSKLGDALQGAQQGMFASGVAGMLGIKQSGTGAALGGALGGVLAPMLGPLAPFAPFLGGILGGTIGGLFKKTPKATSTISNVNGQVDVGAGVGTKSLRSGVEGLGSNVGDTLTRISESLFGSIGNFRVSIGKRGEKFTVDPTGAGRTKGKGVLKFDSEQEAVMAALRDAIGDGAIAGISAASQRILRAGKDLETSITKAAVIESIPRRLMQIKDPVRFAVEELNREFSQMIAYLKEGGATAEQFQQAEELYNLERQKALEAATNQARDTLQSFLDEMKGGRSSPLNKRTVYENAQSQLNRFVADINAGKTVDNNALLEAARNFQDASRALFGSSGNFFADFNFIYDLISRAKGNIADVTNSPNLPASPFSTDPTVAAMLRQTSGDQIGAINEQTRVLGGLLGELLDRFSGGGRYEGALELLPMFSKSQNAL